ncbi:DUF3732 domain-containing protein [Rhizobium phaseoli]|uniref:DUF3732 domain-containing protein n=1 Tax=Rhizobium phaseoli TaxID=396 RepID=UPI000BE8C378|nr:DUF3732 domain-containing protein [Rhizobium phaseoli]PDS29256.1 hypothetical protein CO650_21725 [Rhizobium phaseoli]
MNRWNIRKIAFYGIGGRRRDIEFDLDAVNIITGASGTGKSAIIDAVDYCLGSSNCGLPFFVRGHAEAVAVHWVNGDGHMILGRKIPRAGAGTEQMFVRMGKGLSLPETLDGLEGPTNRETARAMIENAFGISNNEDSNVTSQYEKGRATVRDVTPYLFLSGDMIVSKVTLLHDLNRAEKARDIKATLPYFLGAVDQESVLAGRRLRQLEAALGRLERQNKAQERGQTLITERSMALLSQAAELGLLAGPPSAEASDQTLLDELRKVAGVNLTSPDASGGGERAALEGERKQLVTELQSLRDKRDVFRRTISDASGYESAVSGQSHKLKLVEHLKLGDGRCPICDAENIAGRAMADQIRDSLSIVADEVLSVEVMRPRLTEGSSKIENQIGSKSARLREVEAQLSGLLRQSEESARSGSLLQDRAKVVGRIDQFLETTVKDYSTSMTDLMPLQSEIDGLRDKVDPQARRERLRDAENLVSNFASSMLEDLPTEVPATGSRVVFSSSTPSLSVIEPVRRTVVPMLEVGSDQNYLSLHLALAFSLQKLFETIRSPVPGVLVIDQISRPYYPKGGDEKRLGEMEKDDDRDAMQKIVRFVFEETARRPGLQVILLEHAFIDEDPDYVAAVRERWPKSSGKKLIPSDWPART